MAMMGILNSAQTAREKDYQSIRKHYEFKKKNDSSALPYVRQYMHLARKHRDNARLYQAYKDAVLFSPSEAAKLKYADSAVVFALLTDNDSFITSAYLGKGIIYYFNFRKYRLALNEYLKAYPHAKKTEDEYLKYKVMYHIGVVKNYLGYHEEAEKHFIRCAQHYRKESLGKNHPNQIYNDKKGYYNSLHQLVVCYRYGKQGPRSDSLIALGLKLIADDGDFELERSYFLKCKGIRAYNNNDIHQSINDLETSLPMILKVGDFSWASVVYYYLAKDYLQLRRNDRAMDYFRKVDSIFNRYDFILPELRPGYEYLIKNYKEKKDIRKELYYTDQLLRADSLIMRDFSYLSGKIHMEYDTRMLMDEKERLESSNYNRWLYGILTSVLIVILLILFIFKYRKEKRISVQYQLLQEKLLDRASKPREKEPFIADDLSKVSVLTQELNNDLEAKIKKFEDNRGYTVKGLTLAKLASKLGTNTYYLSTYINETKEVNFNRYLTRLRIEFITDLMNSNKRYLNYNLEALASECGISSRQHFSDLFFEVNGIRPTDFIRKRKEELEGQMPEGSN